VDDARISKRPDVRNGVLKRWFCDVCGHGTVRHVDPLYGRPWCEGALVTALGVACEPHEPRYMTPLDRQHDDPQ